MCYYSNFAFEKIMNEMSNITHEASFCLICINKCPLAGVRYSWSAIKDYFDWTMEHFFLSRGRPFTIVNGRRIYLKKRYYYYQFNKKGFWDENAHYYAWRVRYNGINKKFNLYKCPC